MIYRIELTLAVKILFFFIYFYIQKCGFSGIGERKIPGDILLT